MLSRSVFVWTPSVCAAEDKASRLSTNGADGLAGDDMSAVENKSTMPQQMLYLLTICVIALTL